MKRFRVRAVEYRKRGALGVYQKNLDLVIDAENKDAVMSKVYEKYQDLHGLSVRTAEEKELQLSLDIAHHLVDALQGRSAALRSARGRLLVSRYTGAANDLLLDALNSCDESRIKLQHLIVQLVQELCS